jgi:hypothetical protein
VWGCDNFGAAITSLALQGTIKQASNRRDRRDIAKSGQKGREKRPKAGHHNNMTSLHAILAYLLEGKRHGNMNNINGLHIS